MPSRRTLVIMLIIALAALAVAEGAAAVRQFGAPVVSKIAPSPSPKVTPSPRTSPSPTQIAGPLTAQITSTSCPAAHVGDPACWTVTFVNTGPAITKLAVIFVTAKPYTNWFEHHTGASLAGTDPAAGCDFDTVRVQIVCGPVAAGAHLTLHVSGFIANVGSYQYGVRFGDIAPGFLSDVNDGPDGLATVYAWTETIT